MKILDKIIQLKKIRIRLLTVTLILTYIYIKSKYIYDIYIRNPKFRSGARAKHLSPFTDDKRDKMS